MWLPHIALIHWCVTVFNSTNCLLVMYVGHINWQCTWFKLSKRLSLRSKLFPLSDFNKHAMKDASKKTLTLLMDEILSKKKKKWEATKRILTHLRNLDKFSLHCYFHSNCIMVIASMLKNITNMYDNVFLIRNNMDWDPQFDNWYFQQNTNCLNDYNQLQWLLVNAEQRFCVCCVF